MKKRIYALILGGIFALAGCPLTSIAQTASTAEPTTVTKGKPYKENWANTKVILKKKIWTQKENPHRKRQGIFLK